MNAKTYCLLLCVVLVCSACDSGRESYTVGVSQCSEDNWREKMNEEMLSAAYAEGDIRLQIVSANDDSKMQERQIREFVDQEVDLIVVSPNQSSSISSALDRARAKGIPVICFDRKVEANNYSAFIGADNKKVGEEVAKFLAAAVGYKGVVLVFRGLEGSSPAADRHEGFMNVMKQHAGITVVDGGTTDWTSEGASQTVSSFLSRHPDLRPDAIFGQNDRIAVVARELYKSHGLSPICVGVDALPTAEGGLQQVARGELAASYLYPTRGDLVVKLAKRVLTGQAFERETYLSSALITQENAEAMLTQIDDIRQMQRRITVMNSQIDGFLVQLNTQRTLFALLTIIVLLLIFIIVYVFHEQVIKRQRAVAATNDRLRFFTNVSHEFRTPLTLIADPLSRIAQDRSLTSDSRRLLSLAQRQVDVLLQLVGQILDLRKIQNEKMEVCMKEVDLAAKIRDWAEGFKPLAETRGLNLVTLVPEHMHVRTDVAIIERIVYNLVSNAMKYSPRGTAVEIALHSNQKGFVLSVKDYGSGISSKNQKRIFNRFYQTDSSVSGTGIGLSLVQELVGLMQGHVSVESKLGEGATFLVALPDHVSQETGREIRTHHTPVASHPQQESHSSEVDGNADMVLIVDDNDDVRAYLCETLTHAGYRVLEAMDGQEGFDMATQEVPDLIVSDVMMPVMDGHELCRRIKRQTATSHIPVLLLTAQVMDEQRAEGYDTGADAYLTKPFSSRVLLSRIQNLLKNRLLLKNIFSASDTFALQSDVEAATLESSGLYAIPGAEPAIESAFLESFRQKVEEKMMESAFSVEMLAADLHLSRVQMYRKVKALTGKNPVELIREARLLRADSLLRSGKYTASEVAYQTGFSSPSYFTKCYKEYFGRKPSANTHV